MKLLVCALADLATQARDRRLDGVVSLLSPDLAAPAFPGDTPHLIQRFNDIAAPREGLATPGAEGIGALLAFADRLLPDATLLVHCWMGISRSPAAAFIIACRRAPEVPELEIALALRDAAPGATPNPLMIQIADDRLGRGGKMRAAIAHIGRGRDSAMGTPFEIDTARLRSGRRTSR
jgi:predicted protein tyrosine phosphatase